MNAQHRTRKTFSTKPVTRNINTLPLPRSPWFRCDEGILSPLPALRRLADETTSGASPKAPAMSPTQGTETIQNDRRTKMGKGGVRVGALGQTWGKSPGMGEEMATTSTMTTTTTTIAHHKQVALPASQHEARSNQCHRAHDRTIFSPHRA